MKQGFTTKTYENANRIDVNKRKTKTIPTLHEKFLKNWVIYVNQKLNTILN